MQKIAYCQKRQLTLNKMTPPRENVEDLVSLHKLFSHDLLAEESVLGEYNNWHAALNAWEFGKGQGVPCADHENLLKFFIKFDLTS